MEIVIVLDAISKYHWSIRRRVPTSLKGSLRVRLSLEEHGANGEAEIRGRAYRRVISVTIANDETKISRESSPYRVEIHASMYFGRSKDPFGGRVAVLCESPPPGSFTIACSFFVTLAFLAAWLE